MIYTAAKNVLCERHPCVLPRTPDQGARLLSRGFLNPDKGQPTLHSSDLKVTGSIPSARDMLKYPRARYCSPSAARCTPHGWVKCRIQVSIKKYATFRDNIT